MDKNKISIWNAWLSSNVIITIENILLHIARCPVAIPAFYLDFLLDICSLGCKSMRQKIKHFSKFFFSFLKRISVQNPMTLLTMKKPDTIKETKFIDLLMQFSIGMSLCRHIRCLSKYQIWFGKIKQTTSPSKMLTCKSVKLK